MQMLGDGVTAAAFWKGGWRSTRSAATSRSSASSRSIPGRHGPGPSGSHAPSPSRPVSAGKLCGGRLRSAPPADRLRSPEPRSTQHPDRARGGSRDRRAPGARRPSDRRAPAPYATTDRTVASACSATATEPESPLSRRRQGPLTGPLDRRSSQPHPILSPIRRTYGVTGPYLPKTTARPADASVHDRPTTRPQRKRVSPRVSRVGRPRPRPCTLPIVGLVARFAVRWLRATPPGVIYTALGGPHSATATPISLPGQK